MGIVDAIEGHVVYFDANVFVYALEGYQPYIQPLDALFEAVDAGRIRAVTSQLALAEVLVKPLMDDNTRLQEAYADAIRTSGSLSVIDVSREILVQAARLRATHRTLRLPDAIHIATAQSARCDAFLTNDDRLRAVAAPRVLMLSPFVLTGR